MSDIDQMDMVGFLSIRAWEARHKARKKQHRPAYIDQIWPNLK